MTKKKAEIKEDALLEDLPEEAPDTLAEPTAEPKPEELVEVRLAITIAGLGRPGSTHWVSNSRAQRLFKHGTATAVIKPSGS